MPASATASGRPGGDAGFTLVELLVVVLVIGVLAAIALPMYREQQAKSQDADAKSNARLVHGLVERCLTDRDARDYTLCDTNAELGDSTIAIGTAAGEASIIQYAIPGNQYRVKAYSHSGNAFRIIRWDSGPERTCDTAGSGGCPGSGQW